MDETGPTRDETDRAFWSWLGFWLQLLIFGVVAVVGAFFASGGGRPGDYACGMLLIVGVIALAFLRLKHHLDGGTAGWADFVLVDDTGNLAVAIPLFTVVGLAGLFVAHAWERGAMHAAGVALFIVSGVFIFLDIKRVFDRIDSEPR